MITYVDFSLFESPAKVLVNTVNTVGVMGKGIAKEFKRIYPEMFVDYQRLCENRTFDVGELWLYKTPHKWVLNFPTKKHWRSPSKPEYIEEGLRKFTHFYHDTRITSVSFPQLGCGNGELDWKTQVKPLMETYLKNLPIEVFIHIIPSAKVQTPEHRVPKDIAKWLRTQPESLAFSEVWSDLVSIIASKREFETLDGKCTFAVDVFDDDDGGGVHISSGDSSLSLHREQFVVLWQQIRDMGICIPQIMPSGLDIQSEYLLPLLSHLSYLEPVRQSKYSTRLTRDAVGLLLKTFPNDMKTDKIEDRQLQLI